MNIFGFFKKKQRVVKVEQSPRHQIAPDESMNKIVNLFRRKLEDASSWSLQREGDYFNIKSGLYSFKVSVDDKSRPFFYTIATPIPIDEYYNSLNIIFSGGIRDEVESRAKEISSKLIKEYEIENPRKLTLKERIMNSIIEAESDV